MITINTVAVTVIIAWAFWCLLSPRVDDGILGKLLNLSLILAALGVLGEPGQNSETRLNVTIAALGLRHFFIKTYWRDVRDYLIARLCRDCPHKTGSK